eukprot:SM012316S25884  [mRNA]  locus=s12316:32:384:- [translate_table: standard]
MRLLPKASAALAVVALLLATAAQPPSEVTFPHAWSQAVAPFLAISSSHHGSLRSWPLRDGHRRGLTMANPPRRRRRPDVTPHHFVRVRPLESPPVA